MQRENENRLLVVMVNECCPSRRVQWRHNHEPVIQRPLVRSQGGMQHMSLRPQRMRTGCFQHHHALTISVLVLDYDLNVLHDDMTHKVSPSSSTRERTFLLSLILL
jgi:hypothetical protein